MSYDTLKPLTVPPVAGQGPAAPGTTGAQKSADGLPMLQPMGVRTNLFSNKLSGDGARLDRLENAVQEIRNDFDAMAPAIVRLVAIEQDIQNLITQLEVLTGSAPAPIESEAVPLAEKQSYEEFPPMDGSVQPQPLLPSSIDGGAAQQPAEEAMDALAAVPAPTPATETAVAATPVVAQPTQPAQPIPAASQAASSVVDVRIGEHPGKTRLVLDVKGATTFKTNLDNTEKLLLVELADASWQAAMQKTFNGAPLLASYQAQVEGKGIILIIQLKAGAKIVDSTSLNDKGKGTQRIIIDIAPL